MITLYGMSDTFGMVALESTQNRYLDGRRVLNCSEETATKIDDEISRMLKEAYDEAYRLLQENEPLMDKLAEYLIQKETITGKEFMEIYNRELGITPEDKKQEEGETTEGSETIENSETTEGSETTDH